MNEQAGKAPKRGRGRPASRAENPALRDALLHAALTCFGARGFDGTSLSQIAGMAGTDVGLTRYYFGSKEALWFSSVDHLAATLGRELQAELDEASGNAATQLERAIRWFIRMSARHPYLSRIIVLDGAQNDARGKHIATAVVGPFYRLVSELIAAAKKERRIPDVSPRTIFFMITHGGSFPMAMPALTNAFPGGAISTPKALEAHADAIIALVMRSDHQ